MARATDGGVEVPEGRSRVAALAHVVEGGLERRAAARALQPPHELRLALAVLLHELLHLAAHARDLLQEVHRWR